MSGTIIIDIMCIAMIVIVIFYCICTFIGMKLSISRCKECKADKCYCSFCSNGTNDSIFRDFIVGIKFMFKINQ